MLSELLKRRRTPQTWKGCGKEDDRRTQSKMRSGRKARSSTACDSQNVLSTGDYHKRVRLLKSAFSQVAAQTKAPPQGCPEEIEEFKKTKADTDQSQGGTGAAARRSRAFPDSFLR